MNTKVAEQTVDKPMFSKEGKFNLFLPIDIQKTADANQNADDNNYVIVAGWASTPTWDTQGESVEAIGIDDSYFKQAGWINYEHNSDDVIGIPTSNTFTDPNKGLYVEAKLFKDKPEVQTILELYNHLKEIGSERKLGFSIEGQVKDREADNPKIIRSVWITAVAVTKNPSNPDATWELLQKSNALVAGYGITPDTQTTGGTLIPESLSAKVTQLSYGLANLDSTRLQKLTEESLALLNGRPSDSLLAKVLTLQITSGVSRNEAIKLLAKEDISGGMKS